MSTESFPWIAVADRLPPLSTRVLVADEEGISFGAFYRGFMGRPCVWSTEGLRGTPTYWMPIPDLPTTETA